MEIGKVIRKYRKDLQLTQEEMANRLGVTTPAVNKWENGVSLPDVTMLVPIARLLGISVDTLLSFHENLTETEVREIITELWAQLNRGNYEAAQVQIRKKIETYPNCHLLMLLAAQALDAYYVVMPMQKNKDAESFVESCYRRALESEEETVRIGAADALFHKSVREEKYEDAEAYLHYFSVENPERKRKQALLYGKTGRVEEACRAYEELLYAGCQTARMVFQSLYSIAKEQGDLERAKLMAEKHNALVCVYDMGECAEAAVQLEYALDVKDEALSLAALKRVLDRADTILAAAHSPLYAHMQFNRSDTEFADTLRCKLKQEVRNDERFFFLRGNPMLEELIT